MQLDNQQQQVWIECLKMAVAIAGECRYTVQETRRNTEDRYEDAILEWASRMWSIATNPDMWAPDEEEETCN